MAEYIDINELLTVINSNVAQKDKERCVQLLDAILDAPTADVVEVRHGNAICKDHDEWWGAVYECSLCGKKWMLESSSYKAHYCPWCGAKMDGERKEQK